MMLCMLSIIVLVLSLYQIVKGGCSEYEQYRSSDKV